MALSGLVAVGGVYGVDRAEPAAANPSTADPDPTGQFTPVTSTRILDTRDATGAPLGPVGPGVERDLQIAGAPGLPPSGIAAVVLNVTVTNPSIGGYISFWPAGEARPSVSNVNMRPGQTVANLVTVRVGEGGKVRYRNAFGVADVIGDVVGFYSDGSGPVGHRFDGTLEPARVYDTRSGSGPVGPGLTRSVSLATVLPSDAVAVVLKVVAIEPTVPNYVSVFSGDLTTPPTASTLNAMPEDNVANQVIVPLPADKTVKVFNSAGSTHIAIDRVGYYRSDPTSPQGRFVGITPKRLLDTREGGGTWIGTTERFVDVGTAIGRAPNQIHGSVLNIAATDAAGYGYLQAFPANGPGVIPFGSTLDFSSNEVAAIHATVGDSWPVDTQPDRVGLRSPIAPTHVVVDIFGYFT